MTTQPQRAPEARPRYHEVDALRSSLMLLGVVFHASNVYAVHERWLVRATETHLAFDVLAGVTHLFRMPAFFVVSGYFSAMLLRRWAAGAFLRDRARRLGVPLVTTLLTVNLVEFWVLHGRHDGPVGAAFAAAWREGHVLGHLWFLVDLLVFCALLVALAPVMRGAPAARLRAALGHPHAMTALVALAVVGGLVSPATGHLAGGALDGSVLGLLQPLEFLRFLPAFGLGVLLQSEPTALVRFSRAGWGSLLTGLAALGVVLVLARGEGALAKSGTYVAYLTLSWVAVRGVFALFHHLAHRSSPTFTYLADASYSVYLLHHVLVISVATALLPTGWPAWSQFAVVLGVASGVPLAIHHLVVRRSAVLALLLNGKRLPRRTAAAAGLATE